MAVCLGGRVQSITLSPDTSGLTSHSISRSRIRQSLVASAGYLGSTVAGCLLYGSSVRYASHSNWIISTLGAAMGLSLIFWIRNLFGAFVVLSWAIVLIALGQNSLWGLTPGPLLLFLAIQTGLQSLFDLRILFELDAGIQSDAKTLQSLLWLPAGFWALFWIGLSLLVMGWTIRWT